MTTFIKLEPHLYAREGKRVTSYFTMIHGKYVPLGRNIAIAQAKRDELQGRRIVEETIQAMCSGFLKGEMLYELDDPDLALLAKARKALAEEKIGALDHDDIADLIRLVNNLAGNDSDDVPRWPYRVMDISPHGYVVWRDVFEGRELSDPQRAALMHQTAVFVCEVEAIDYCRYRNARTVRVGHDGIDYPPQTQKSSAPP